MKWMDKILLRKTFKNQVMLLFLPITIVIILIIGIFVYSYGKSQVQYNAEYLMTNTTKQTANLVNDKIEFIFNQCNTLNNTTSVWRLVNNSYKEEKSKMEYSDILNVYDTMQNIYSSSEIMDSIAFKTIYGNQLIVYKDMIYDKFLIGLDQYSGREFEGNYGYTWINSHIDEVFPTKIPREVISLVSQFRNMDGQNVGVMIFNLKSSYLKELLNQVEISKNGYALLLSEDGGLSPDQPNEKYSLSEEQLERLRDKIGTSGSMELKASEGNEKLSIYYSPLEVNNWLVVSVVPQSDLFSRVNTFRLILGIILLVSVFVAGVISMYSAKFISKPIEQLSDQVLEFHKNPNVIFSVKTGNEISTLARELNNFRDSLDILLNQVKEEQKQKSRLELMVMQAQIKPHFLYNTLTSIRHLIDMGDVEKGSQICTNLIQFYKIGLSNGKEVITIGEEIEHIRNYLEIQKLRYKDNIEYNIDVSGQITKMKLLRLSLQPLVENAIYHGLKPKGTPGMIIISGERIENKIRLVIYDDGVGMSEKQLNEVRKKIESSNENNYKGSFGIRNVYARLKLFFGEDLSMEINSCKDVYTEIKLELPIIEDNRGEQYV